ncbi:MAG TPA: hypothetical protein VFM18_06250 [Methanosarcina sp.]|nr:hypothetical protein [Methanosarcina sp.]
MSLLLFGVAAASFWLFVVRFIDLIFYIAAAKENKVVGLKGDKMKNNRLKVINGGKK